MDNYLFEVIEAPLPRRKIEVDLLVRHKQLQRKIEALKVKRMKEEVKHNQQVPKINPNSRKIALSMQNSTSHSKSRLQRTFEILSSSRFMPKKVSICLESLETSFTPNKSCQKLAESRVGDALNHDPVSFPSYEYIYKDPAARLEAEKNLPADILKRNQLLNTLRSETVARGFANEHEEPPGLLDIHERTKRWLKRKEEKLKELKKAEENKSLAGCTFKPKLKNLRCFSVNNTHRTLNSECSYSDLYERKKKFNKDKGCRSDRTISQETKACTAIHSARRPSSNQSNYLSPRYNSLCPVKFNFCELSGYNRLKNSSKEIIGSKSIKSTKKND